MHTKFLVSAAAGALLAMTGAAFAQSAVVATTDLNVRAGPSSQHQVLGVIGAGQSVTLDGCMRGSKWCVVAFAGGQGWVYSDYLTGDFGGTQVVVTERPVNSRVRIIEREDIDGGATGAVTGGVTGAVAGAIVGGPVGAAVGGGAGFVAGGAAGQAIDPPARVRTYVRSNAIEPVYLDGEVAVGAGLPETVVLRRIPDYEYRYSYVNGQPVLVEPSSRRIVYVMR
jgi:SH3-like domain-containing protein